MAGEECLPQRAAELAESMLSGLDRRWRHVQGVARCALQLARLTPPENASHLIAAAWLHDLGYASLSRSRGCTRWTGHASSRTTAGLHAW